MIKTPLQQTRVGQQRPTMRHLKLKCQDTRQKSTHSFIYQPHLAMFRKAIIKVTKMNTDDKQFLHEPRTRKNFMILVSQKRLEKTEPLCILRFRQGFQFLLQVLNDKTLAETKL